MTSDQIDNDSGPGSFAGLPIKTPADFNTPESGAFFTVYGQGGAGKTTLVADVHKLGKTLHLDAEGGSEAISHLKDKLDIIEVLRYSHFDAVSRKLWAGGHGYKNVIVDNLCEIISLDLKAITGSGTDAPEIQEWGKMTRDILFATRQYRDMARQQGVNVFFLAWDSDEKDDRGVLKKDLAFTPALRKEYPGVVTVIAHVRVLDDPTKRMLDFAPGPRTVSKFRRSADSAATKVPFQITYGLDKLPIVDIIRTMRGEQEWPESKYRADRTPAK